MLEINRPEYKERYAVFTHIYYEMNKLVIREIAIPYNIILFCRDRTDDFAEIRATNNCTELSLYPNSSVNVVGNFDDIMDTVTEKNKMLDL